MATVTSAVILEPKKIKPVTVSTISPSISHEVMGLDAMMLVFWMLIFKPTFSLFHFQHGGELWENVVHRRRQWQTTSVFLLENPMNVIQEAECKRPACWVSRASLRAEITAVLMGRILHTSGNLGSNHSWTTLGPGEGRLPSLGYYLLAHWALKREITAKECEQHSRNSAKQMKTSLKF